MIVGPIAPTATKNERDSREQTLACVSCLRRVTGPLNRQLIAISRTNTMAPSVFWDVPNSNLPGSAPDATLDNLPRLAPQERCDFLGSIGPHSGELIGSTNGNLGRMNTQIVQEPTIVDSQRHLAHNLGRAVPSSASSAGRLSGGRNRSLAPCNLTP